MEFIVVVVETGIKNLGTLIGKPVPVCFFEVEAFWDRIVLEAIVFEENWEMVRTVIQNRPLKIWDKVRGTEGEVKG